MILGVAAGIVVSKTSWGKTVEDEHRVNTSAGGKNLRPAVLTLIVSFATRHSQVSFLLRSTGSNLVRLVMITLVTVTPILLVPKLFAFVGMMMRDRYFFGQFVKTSLGNYRNPSMVTMWFLRPLQCIALSLVFAERLLQFLDEFTEFNVGSDHGRFLLWFPLLVGGSALVSLLLSVLWAFDDVGIRIYNERKEEMHAAGSTVGIVLPLITGILGLSSLFQRSLITDALKDLLGITSTLYPPYVLLVIFHHRFIGRRGTALLQKLSFKRIETRMR